MGQKKKINFNTNKLFSKEYCGTLVQGIIVRIIKKFGFAIVQGLLGVKLGEMVTIGLSKITGMVLSLGLNSVRVKIFDSTKNLKKGDAVYRSFIIMGVPSSLSLWDSVIEAWRAYEVFYRTHLCVKCTCIKKPTTGITNRRKGHVKKVIHISSSIL